MGYVGVFCDSISKIGINTKEEYIQYLKDNGVGDLPNADDYYLRFCVIFKQTEKITKTERTIVQHVVISTYYSELKALELEDSTIHAVLEQLKEYFQANATVQGLKPGKSFYVPCLLYKVDGEIHLKFAWNN